MFVLIVKREYYYRVTSLYNPFLIGLFIRNVTSIEAKEALASLLFSTLIIVAGHAESWVRICAIREVHANISPRKHCHPSSLELFRTP